MTAKIVAVAAAGALGTLARCGLAGLTHKLNATAFPWGTLAVNLSGCFLVGLLWSLFESRWPVAGGTRVVVLIGFMGAFMSFSAYMLETGDLVRSAQWVAGEKKPHFGKEMESSMINLRDKDSGNVLGSVSEADLQFLIDHLEEEWDEDQDYYLTRSTYDMLKEKGAGKALQDILGPVFEDREEIEIEWFRA
jgi:CrcB protein